jgi:hypothetical protein
LILDPTFLSGLLDFVFGILLFLDRSHVPGALFIVGLLLATPVANDTLALVVWHGSFLLNRTTGRDRIGSIVVKEFSVLTATTAIHCLRTGTE